MPGPIEYQSEDLRIALGDSVAFCHSLSHVKSTRANGEKAELLGPRDRGVREEKRPNGR